MRGLLAFITILSNCQVIACGGNTQSGGYVGADEIEREYRVEAGRLELPPHVSWPQTVDYAAHAEDGRTIMYGRGVGQSDADWYWYCKWADVAVVSRGSDRLEAVNIMDRIFALPYTQFLDEPGQSSLRAQIDLAKRGDVTLIESELRANCSNPP